MANSFKDIIITPNRSNTADPKIEFRGGNTSVNTAITMQTYPTSNGTLSFEGSAGQLFSITNDLTGSIFSVNDVSGIPSIEVFANGQINMAQYGGNVVIGSNAVSFGNGVYVAANSNVGIGTSTPPSKLAVVTTSSSGATLGNWTSSHVAIGPAVGSISGGGIGFGYNTSTDQAEIVAIAPGVAWKPLSIFSNGVNFNSIAGGVAVTINGSGQLGAAVDIRSPIYYDGNNTAYYADPDSTSNFNFLNVGGAAVYRSDFIAPFHSNSDFVDGTLVTSNIPASAAEGDSFVIEITGKSYSGTNPPFKVIAQGYLYSSSILSKSGISYGGNFAAYIKVFEEGGVLKFWWPRIDYWHSFDVIVKTTISATNGTLSRNRVTAITNSTEPTGTKKVQIDLARFLRADISATNTVDLRAPRFYDSEDTAYYSDPAGTSSYNVLKAGSIQHSNGNTVINLNSGTYLQLRDPSGNNRIFLGNSADATNYYDNTSHIFRTAAAANMFTLTGTGDGIATSSLRAPIFYDNDNTLYFMDGAGTSQFNTIEAKNGSGFRSFAIPGSGINSQIYFANVANNRAWNWQLDENNNAALWGFNGTTWTKSLSVAPSYAGVFMRNSNGTDVLAFSASNYGYSSAYRTLILGNQTNTTVCIGVDPIGNPSGSFNGLGSGVEVMFKNGVNFITPNAANNSYHTPLTLADGYAASAGSLRAPLFYDSNNTAYYLDPASTSILSGITMNGTLTGVTGRFQKNQTAGNYETAAIWTESYGNTATGIAFHISGNVGKFLEMRTDQMLYWPGIMNASGEYRSPIFRDSDNTGYYIDPNASSRMASLSLDTTLVTSGITGLTTAAIQIAGTYNIGATPSWMPMTHQRAVHDSGYITHLNTGLYKHNVTWGPGISGWYAAIGGNDSSPTEAWYLTYGGLINHTYGYVSTANSFRAPIFYDSDNTAYFIDPTSVSNIYGLAVRGDYGSTAIQNQLFLWGSVTTTSAIGFKANGGSFPNPTGNGDGYNTYLTMDSVGRGWVFRRGTGGADFTAAYTSGWILNNGIWQANASMRSPVFYDSDNTAYYADLASGTRLGSQLEVLGSRNLTYEASGGSLIIKGDSGGWGTGLYFFGSAGTNRGGWGALGGGDALSYLWAGTAFDNTALRVYPASNYAEGTNSLRAPIFYDNNNTAYYADPQATSNFIGLTVSNQITGSVSGSSTFLPTRYDSAVYTNPQQYFSASIGLRVAMTGVPVTWADTLWINGYSGSDVPNMCALHFSRQGSPRMWISTQSNLATAYGTYYEFPTYGYNSAGSTGSLYAGIYYDGNDTAYYTDPRSTSILFRATIRQSAISLGSGNSAQLEINNAGSGACNISFHREGAYGAHFGLDTDNVFSTYGWSAGTGYTSMRVGALTAYGVGTATSDFRAPIFYDQLDTTYFLDPNAATSLRTVGDWRSNSGDWTGEFSGKIQYHANNWYFQSGNEWMFRRADGASALRVEQSGFGTFLSSIRVGSGAASSDIYMADSDEGERRLHCNSNRIGFLTQAEGWGAYCSDNGDWTTEAIGWANASFRSPLFYDSDNTGYVFEGNGTSRWSTSNQDGYHTFNNYGLGIVGLYASTRFQCVYAMGDAYKGNADGTSLSGAYGLWWSYPSAGGPATSLTSHGLMCIVNGSNFAQLDASTRAVTDMRTPIYYDLQDTAYYTDPNSLSRMSLIRADVYGRAAHNTGFLRGGYNNIGASEGQTSPIYCIGSSYEPAATTLGSMYGIGFTSSGSFFPSGASGWGLYVAGGGVARVHLGGDNGEITATGNITAYASDRRLKTNIKPISNAIDKLMRINGVEFDWVDNIQEIGFIPQTMHETGVIAQEIQEVIPDAVKIAPFNKNATDISGVDNEYLTVDKEKIVALLIEAVKEQQLHINRLEEKINKMGINT